MTTREADIAVVVAGASGLAAAIVAAEGGAKVIALKKGSTTGGANNMRMGPLGVENRLQKEKDIEITRDEAFQNFAAEYSKSV